MIRRWRRLWRVRARSGERGFTLVEVLVSLVLLALVLAMLSGAARFARATWDAAARVDREAGYDAASFVRARLGEALPLFEQGERGVVRVAFKGTSETVAFLAPTHNGPAGAGLYRFVLELGPAGSDGASRALVVRLSPYRPRQARDAADLPLEDHVLAENVQSVSFRYFGRKDARSTPVWHAAWPRTDAIPDLVEMTVAYSHREHAEPFIVELRMRQRT